MTTLPRAETAAAARSYGNLLSVWRLCGNTACLRARRCRGDGRTCLDLCLPLTPEPVRDFLAGLGAAQQAGLSWEEALEDLWQEWEAVGEWNATVAQSMAARSRRSANPPSARPAPKPAPDDHGRAASPETASQRR